jgi:hypothetical protein
MALPDNVASAAADRMDTLEAENARLRERLTKTKMPKHPDTQSPPTEWNPPERGTSMTLYGLADTRELLDKALETTEGELTPELEAILDQWELDFDAKAERVALYALEELATAKAIKGEEERLAARRKALEGRADRLKTYLEGQMARVGKRKIEGTYATVAIQDNPPSVVEMVATEEGDFRLLMDRAPEFVTHTPESFAWNKRAILDAHKAKQPLPADIAQRVQITRGQSLRIR